MRATLIMKGGYHTDRAKSRSGAKAIASWRRVRHPIIVGLYSRRTRAGSEGSTTMLQTLREMLSSKDSLARAFSRLGWAGVWIQIVIGAIPVLLAIYALIFGRGAGVGTRGGSLLIECL